LLRVAKAVYEKKLDEDGDLLFDRFNAKLLGELRELGHRAADGKSP
jgi:hypothetical protein